MPGSRGVRAVRAIRCRRSTAPSCRLCPKVNSRRKIPRVDGAYTWSNRAGIPPAQSRFMSSMTSAPVHIPAMIEVSSRPGWQRPISPGHCRCRHGRRSTPTVLPVRPVPAPEPDRPTTRDSFHRRQRSLRGTYAMISTESASWCGGRSGPRHSRLSQLTRHFPHLTRRSTTAIIHGSRIRSEDTRCSPLLVGCGVTSAGWRVRPGRRRGSAEEADPGAAREPAAQSRDLTYQELHTAFKLVAAGHLVPGLRSHSGDVAAFEVAGGEGGVGPLVGEQHFLVGSGQ